MNNFLNSVRFLGLLVFVVGVILSLMTLINFAVGLTEAAWLQIYVIRLYLFLVVSGILLYILITFRKKDGKKE